MGRISIFHGVYDIVFDTAYHINGYFHVETQEYLPISNKLKTYLAIKGLKFNSKDDTQYLFFTLGRDADESIETIALVHPQFDYVNPEIGENVVFGRIKRMRGDIKKIIYEYEEYEIQIKLYDKKKKGGEFVLDKNGYKIPVYKTITRKRLRLDDKGNPIIKRKIYFKPYNLDARHRISKHGFLIAGELKYPYIYKMEKHDHQSEAERIIDDAFDSGDLP